MGARVGGVGNGMHMTKQFIFVRRCWIPVYQT